MRSISAIRRKFPFPTVFDLPALLQLTKNNAQAVINYLHLTESNRHFSSALLKILIEDLRRDNTERINNNRNIVLLVSGDIFMVRTIIQSDASKNKFAKLN